MTWVGGEDGVAVFAEFVGAELEDAEGVEGGVVASDAAGGVQRAGQKVQSEGVTG